MRIPVTRVFAMTMLLTMSSEILSAQSNAVGDTLFALVPYQSNQQGLALDESDSSLVFYVGFDDNKFGTIKEYIPGDSSGKLILEEVNSYPIPSQIHHENDMHVVGDSILITGWTGTNVGYIGWAIKSNGAVFNLLKDSLDAGWWLQFCYFYHDTLFTGITDSACAVRIQAYEPSKGFFDYGQLVPSPIREFSNFVQGSKVIFNHYLAILTSGPTRVDIYDLNRNFAYVKSLLADNNGEAEGLGVHEDSDKVTMFYGINSPNRINTFSFSKHPKPPELEYPPDSSSVSSQSLTFDWAPMNEAQSYLLEVSDSISISSKNIQEKTSTPGVLSGRLDTDAVYFWRVGAITLVGDTVWSAAFLFRTNLPSGVSKIPGQTPSSFYMQPNYPNPFNPATTIEFGIDRTCHVSISVYTTIGEKVAQLLNQNLSEGRYKVRFNGSGLPSGVYFCQFVVGGFTKSEKIVLIK